MPFDPAQVVFRRGDVSCVIDFYDKWNGETPWIVSSAKIAGYNVQKKNWTLTNVGPHPDPAKKDIWMQGTLKFNAKGLEEPGDAWLKANWPLEPSSPDGTLELNVSCNYQPRSLTVKLRA